MLQRRYTRTSVSNQFSSSAKRNGLINLSRKLFQVELNLANWSEY